MILDQLFETAGEDSTAQRVAEMLRTTHPNPSEATEREILAATSRVLTDQGMSNVRVRFYLRDPDFQSDIIEAVQSRLQGVTEALKPSDIPPTMRDRLTMRDIEAERPAGAYRFRVTFPDGATADFMDFEAAQQRAAADRGRISRLSEEKSPSARVERILKMLRARHPQAENDLEALIFDFRSQQAQDRSDITRLDAENDMEEADIQRLERMLDLVKKRRATTAESLRTGEHHVATVTLDDGTVKKVRIASDEGFRDQIAKHFQKQGRTVTDIDVDYSVRSELDEAKKKPQPTNPELWSRAKSAARSKFDVYPSAYANAWAAKWYKSKGGGWRMGKPKKD